MNQAITIFLVEHLIMIGLVIPIIIIGFDRGRNYRNIFLFIIFFFVTNLLNALPEFFDTFIIIKGNWNWNGKLLSFLFSILFIVIFNRMLKDNNFFTFKLERKSIKPTITVLIVIVLILALFTIISAENTEFDIETLAFQLSLPALDEEFSFRGIMIGLLIPSLRNYFRIGKIKLGNPSIWITGVLFGLVHGLNLSIDWKLQMDYFSFGYTFALGLIWGWMVWKSRSILMPLISHCSNNFIVTLITMIK